MKAFQLFLSTLALAVLVGCGSGNSSVSGTIKVKGGGPVTKGSVFFDSGKYRVGGIIKPDGTYFLQGDTTGAPPGNYKVYFTGTDEGDYTAPKPVIDKRYMAVESTDLTAEVKGQTNTIDFELDPPK